MWDLNTKNSYFEHVVFVVTHMNTMFGIWLYRVVLHDDAERCQMYD